MKDIFKKIDKYLKEKKYNRALNLLLDKKTGKIQNKFKEDLFRVWKAVGEIYIKLNNFSDAIKALKKAQTYTTKDSEIVGLIGYCYEKLNNLKLAERFYKKAIKLSSKDPVIYCNLGNLYYFKEKYNEAISCYEKAKKYSKPKSRISKFAKEYIEQTNYEYYSALVTKLRKNKRYKKALSLLLNNKTGKIRKEFKFDLHLSWYEVGVIYYKQNKYNDAIVAFKKSLSKSKQCAKTLMAIGTCYLEIEKPKLAERYLRKATANTKKNPDILYNLANSLFDQKEYKKAIKIYEKVINMSPKKDEVNRWARNNVIYAKDELRKKKSV